MVVMRSELVAVERVRCLECSTSYLKPCGGSTFRRNPGCPSCGYVGWISAFVPVSDAQAPRAPRRFGGGRPRLQLHPRR